MNHPFPLGRVPGHADAKSLAFAAAGPTPADKKWRLYGYVLDQGQVGSCTGNAGVGALNHAPLHTLGSHVGREVDAVYLYTQASAIFPGPGYSPLNPATDTGSSGLAVAQVLRSQGRIASYTHAWSAEGVASALQVGPMILGVDWYEDDFWPASSGLIPGTGGVAGGHEVVIDGVDVSHRTFRCLNSWTNLWGVGGRFYIGWDDLDRRLGDGGDAIQLVR